MQIPSMLCGSSRPVAAACRKQITRFLRGAPWIDAGLEYVAAQDAPGLIMLNGPAPLLGGEHNVHAYSPFWELGKLIDHDRVTLDAVARAFEEALEQPWSILGLLSQTNYRWFDDPGRAEAFLAAMAHHWHELDALGPRYTMGSRNGLRLWEVPVLLHYVLAKRGIPLAVLNQPLPGNDLAALVASTRAAG